jgi:fatty acid desaturase
MITLNDKRALSQLRPLIWFLDFSLDWFFIVGVFIFVKMTPYLWVWPLASLLIGARLHALAILGHEATHKLAFKNRFLNDAISEIFIAWPLFVVIDKGYRPWHFDHHRGLGTPSDPEMNYRSADTYSGQATWAKIAGLFFLDLIGYGIPELVRFIIEVAPKSKKRELLKPLLFWGVFISVSFYLKQGWIPLLWLYSIATGFWAIFRVRTFLEHVSVNREGKENSHRFTANLLARFFFVPHNTYCHYEHHKFPQVPYYHLPKLRELDSTVPVLPLIQLFPWTESTKPKYFLNRIASHKTGF